MQYNYLFGPVPSRRLGISLGVDLVPMKTCTVNCIYCECGETSRLTLERREYVPFAAVEQELSLYFENNPPPDYITFSGSGEPTLNSRIKTTPSKRRTTSARFPILGIANSNRM